MNVLILANAHSIGGGELSTSYIVKMLLDAGHTVTWLPVKTVHKKLIIDSRCKVLAGIDSYTHQEHYDLFILYANDFVYRLRIYRKVLENIIQDTPRCVAVLNFCIGQASDEWFLSQLDAVVFLNTTKQREFLLKVFDTPITRVLPPPVDIEPFLTIQPDYSKVTFVRHGRHNTKYDVQPTVTLVECMLNHFPDAHHYYMATPPFLLARYSRDPRFHLYGWDKVPVPDLLASGSLFHYHLPERLCDQGPRVIVEAMAAGIPVMADNRDGARDRVTPETGWLCDNLQDYYRHLHQLMRCPEELKEKGTAAKARAAMEFRPERWVDVLVGN